MSGRPPPTISGDFVMLKSQGNTMAASKREQDLRVYFTREPVILALLFALVVVFFLAVTGLSHVYHAQQESLGNRWFTRGVTDLNERLFGPAVADFRTALLYSRDNYSYQLNLAEALTGLKRTDEAYSYLITLWERELTMPSTPSGPAIRKWNVGTPAWSSSNICWVSTPRHKHRLS